MNPNVKDKLVELLAVPLMIVYQYQLSKRCYETHSCHVLSNACVLFGFAKQVGQLLLVFHPDEYVITLVSASSTVTLFASKRVPAKDKISAVVKEN